MPRIIRLLGYEKLPRQDVKFNRRNIYARDGNRCQYCGKRMPTTELSLDHVVPKSQGGRSTWENIVCCCVKMQREKGRADAGAGAHASDGEACEAEAQPGDQHPPGGCAVFELEAVPGYGVLDGGAEVALASGEMQ